MSSQETAYKTKLLTTIKLRLDKKIESRKITAVEFMLTNDPEYRDNFEDASTYIETLKEIIELCESTQVSNTMTLRMTPVDFIVPAVSSEQMVEADGLIEQDFMEEKKKILGELKLAFPGCWFKDGGEFDNSQRRLVWSGEGSYIEGMQAFSNDAWETDPDETMYTMMVHNQLNKFVEERGYYWEAYDGGTHFLYKS